MLMKLTPGLFAHYLFKTGLVDSNYKRYQQPIKHFNVTVTIYSILCPFSNIFNLCRPLFLVSYALCLVCLMVNPALPITHDVIDPP
jgi:hypothetical protein